MVGFVTLGKEFWLWYRYLSNSLQSISWGPLLREQTSSNICRIAWISSNVVLLYCVFNDMLITHLNKNYSNCTLSFFQACYRQPRRAGLIFLRVQNVKLVCLYCRSYRFVLLFSDSFWSCFSFVYTIKVYDSKKESLVFTFRVCVLLRFRGHGTCEQTEKNVNRVHFEFMQNLNA